MAKRTHVVLEDDLDGTQAAATFTFALEGVTFEIDLSEANAQRLRDEFAPWVSHARRVSGRKQPAARGRSGAGTGSAADIRRWARNNGHEVSERGRVPSELRAAYEAAR